MFDKYLTEFNNPLLPEKPSEPKTNESKKPYITRN